MVKSSLEASRPLEVLISTAAACGTYGTTFAVSAYRRAKSDIHFALFWKGAENEMVSQGYEISRV